MKSKTVTPSKATGNVVFLDKYRPKICVFSVILATMGDFSDNIFLRAAFGGAIEIPVTTSSSSPCTSTCARSSGAATFSDAPQKFYKQAKGSGEAPAKKTQRNAPRVLKIGGPLDIKSR